MRAARGIRTPDPLITNEVLYQLSYCGDAAPIYAPRRGKASAQHDGAPERVGLIGRA